MNNRCQVLVRELRSCASAEQRAGLWRGLEDVSWSEAASFSADIFLMIKEEQNATTKLAAVRALRNIIERGHDMSDEDVLNVWHSVAALARKMTDETSALLCSVFNSMSNERVHDMPHVNASVSSTREMLVLWSELETWSGDGRLNLHDRVKCQGDGTGNPIIGSVVAGLDATASDVISVCLSCISLMIAEEHAYDNEWCALIKEIATSGQELLERLIASCIAIFVGENEGKLQGFCCILAPLCRESLRLPSFVSFAQSALCVVHQIANDRVQLHLSTVLNVLRSIMQGCDIAFGSIVERHAEMVLGDMTLDAYTPLQEKVRLVYFATVMVLKLAKAYASQLGEIGDRIVEFAVQQESKLFRANLHPSCMEAKRFVHLRQALGAFVLWLIESDLPLEERQSLWMMLSPSAASRNAQAIEDVDHKGGRLMVMLSVVRNKAFSGAVLDDPFTPVLWIAELWKVSGIRLQCSSGAVRSKALKALLQYVSNLPEMAFEKVCARMVELAGVGQTVCMEFLSSAWQHIMKYCVDDSFRMDVIAQLVSRIHGSRSFFTTTFNAYMVAFLHSAIASLAPDTKNTLFRNWFPPRPTAEALKEYAARMAVTPVDRLPRDAQLIAFKAFLEDFIALAESASARAVIDEYEVSIATAAVRSMLEVENTRSSGLAACQHPDRIVQRIITLVLHLISVPKLHSFPVLSESIIALAASLEMYASVKDRAKLVHFLDAICTNFPKSRLAIAMSLCTMGTTSLDDKSPYQPLYFRKVSEICATLLADGDARVVAETLRSLVHACKHAVYDFHGILPPLAKEMMLVHLKGQIPERDVSDATNEAARQYALISLASSVKRMEDSVEELRLKLMQSKRPPADVAPRLQAAAEHLMEWVEP